MARRKALYEAEFPETKNGATLKQGDHLPSRHNGEAGKAQRFTAKAAELADVSERSIQRAAREAGASFDVQEYDGDDPLGLVVSLNLKRRHLTESQRAMVAAKLAKMPLGANQHAQICAPSQSNAAEMLSVSRRAVQTAKSVQASATPELIAAVEQGKVAVSAAKMPLGANQHTQGSENLPTQGAAAKLLNVSGRSVRTAKQVQERAAPELIAAVEQGKVATLQAHRPSKSENLPTSELSQSQAAQILNVSDRSIRTAKQVQENATPELIAAVEQCKVAVSAGGGGETRVVVQLSPDLEARILEQAGQQSVRVTQAGLQQYDRNVAPLTVKRIVNDPRQVG